MGDSAEGGTCVVCVLWVEWRYPWLTRWVLLLLLLLEVCTLRLGEAVQLRLKELFGATDEVGVSGTRCSLTPPAEFGESDQLE